MRSVFSQPAGKSFRGSGFRGSVHSIHHFVPKGISSSMRDFIILVLILTFLMICFFEKYSPSKKKKSAQRKIQTFCNRFTVQNNSDLASYMKVFYLNLLRINGRILMFIMKNIF